MASYNSSPRVSPLESGQRSVVKIYQPHQSIYAGPVNFKWDLAKSHALLTLPREAARIHLSVDTLYGRHLLSSTPWRSTSRFMPWNYYNHPEDDLRSTLRFHHKHLVCCQTYGSMGFGPANMPPGTINCSPYAVYVRAADRIHPPTDWKSWYALDNGRKPLPMFPANNITYDHSFHQKGSKFETDIFRVHQGNQPYRGNCRIQKLFHNCDKEFMHMRRQRRYSEHRQLTRDLRENVSFDSPFMERRRRPRQEGMRDQPVDEPPVFRPRMPMQGADYEGRPAPKKSSRVPDQNRSQRPGPYPNFNQTDKRKMRLQQRRNLKQVTLLDIEKAQKYADRITRARNSSPPPPPPRRSTSLPPAPKSPTKDWQDAPEKEESTLLSMDLNSTYQGDIDNDLSELLNNGKVEQATPAADMEFAMQSDTEDEVVTRTISKQGDQWKTCSLTKVKKSEFKKLMEEGLEEHDAEVRKYLETRHPRALKKIEKLAQLPLEEELEKAAMEDPDIKAFTDEIRSMSKKITVIKRQNPLTKEWDAIPIGSKTYMDLLPTVHQALQDAQKEKTNATETATYRRGNLGMSMTIHHLRVPPFAMETSRPEPVEEPSAIFAEGTINGDTVDKVLLERKRRKQQEGQHNEKVSNATVTSSDVSCALLHFNQQHEIDVIDSAHPQEVGVKQEAPEETNSSQPTTKNMKKQLTWKDENTRGEADGSAASEEFEEKNFRKLPVTPVVSPLDELSDISLGDQNHPVLDNLKKNEEQKSLSNEYIECDCCGEITPAEEISETKTNDTEEELPKENPTPEEKIDISKSKLKIPSYEFKECHFCGRLHSVKINQKINPSEMWCLQCKGFHLVENVCNPTDPDLPKNACIYPDVSKNVNDPVLMCNVCSTQHRLSYCCKKFQMSSSYFTPEMLIEQKKKQQSVNVEITLPWGGEECDTIELPYNCYTVTVPEAFEDAYKNKNEDNTEAVRKFKHPLAAFLDPETAKIQHFRQNYAYKRPKRLSLAVCAGRRSATKRQASTTEAEEVTAAKVIRLSDSEDGEADSRDFSFDYPDADEELIE